MCDPLYLKDSYLRGMEATVTEVMEERENRWQLLLDKTVFYPMGGGQPTDQGQLTSAEGSWRIYQVLQKGEKIIHYIEGAIPPCVGKTVKGEVDWERRYLNMRLHSAGHIIDFALYLMGLSPAPLKPQKGDHGKKPFISYEGTAGRKFREELEKKANELVVQNLSFSTRFAPLEEIETLVAYLQPGLPKHKPLRLLSLEGVGAVCDGGTQVRSTGEVGPIALLPIEEKNGETLIHYRLSSNPSS